MKIKIELQNNVMNGSSKDTIFNFAELIRQLKKEFPDIFKSRNVEITLVTKFCD